MLSSLNPIQRQAVEYIDGPELVIAGAGSGKTRVLTHKVAFLMQQGIHPGNILALTFTNKAAREMKERIAQLLPKGDARYLWMGTFHSIAARILRSEAEALGYTRDFTIYDTSDTKALIKRILKERELDEKIYKLGNVLAKISAAKNALITPEEYGKRTDIYRQDREQRMYEMPAVYLSYEQHLRTANAMDFDDLLVNLYRLLQQNENVRNKYQDAFQYVLVDEYQDTNHVQYLLVKLLAEPSNMVCVVGDDAQSIYSFRGADIRNILQFQHTYPNAKLFKLERNYRSTQTIVQAANSLIKHNEYQIYKEVYSEKEKGNAIDLCRFSTDRDEGDGVARMIQQQDINTLRYSPDDIAILYRTNAQSRVFENALRQLNIPYRIYGGTSFYQRKEVKDTIAYFRLAVNTDDDAALQRVINLPTRGIGDTTLKKMADAALLNGVSLFEICTDPARYSLPVSTTIAKKLMLFAAMVQRFSEQKERLDAYEFADMVMRESGLATAIAMDKTPEGIDRAENMEELMGSIHEFVETYGDGAFAVTETETAQENPMKPRITDFLAEVSLLTDQDEKLEDHTPRVTLMTVHAAKGLEFPVVYIVGMEENLFPSQMSVRPQEIEEERRLLYVAITRAMNQCHLSFAQQRFRNGKTEFTSPSRFLSEMDRNCIHITASYISSMRSSSLAFKEVRLEVYPDTIGNRTTALTGDAGGTSRQVGHVSPAVRYSNTQASSLANNLQCAPRPTEAHDTLATKRHVTAAKSEMLMLYKEGERVSHRTFGKGTVIRAYHDKDSGNDKIEIAFDEHGVKTLLLTYAKLLKLP